MRAGGDQSSGLRSRGDGSSRDFSEELTPSQQGIDDVAAPPGKAHHRSIVLLSFSPFTQVVVARRGMAVRRDPRRSKHRVFQAFISGPGGKLSADRRTRPPGDRRDASVSGQVCGVGEVLAIADGRPRCWRRS